MTASLFEHDMPLRRYNRRVRIVVIAVHGLIIFLIMLSDFWLPRNPHLQVLRVRLRGPLAVRPPGPTARRPRRNPPAPPKPAPSVNAGRRKPKPAPTHRRTVRKPAPRPPRKAPRKSARKHRTPVRTPKKARRTRRTQKSSPRKKRWRPRSPEEIRKAIRRRGPKRKPAPAVLPALSKPHFDARRIASAIGRKIPHMAVAMAPLGARESAPENLPDYFQAVAARLYRLWVQPDRSEVGNANPTVSVRITVDRNGRVRRAVILRPSGIPAMDTSIRTVLKNLEHLPAPSDFGLHSRTLHIDITFKLD